MPLGPEEGQDVARQTLLPLSRAKQPVRVVLGGGKARHHHRFGSWMEPQRPAALWGQMGVGPSEN